MTERFPDLEIYLMKGDPAKVTEWLRSVLGEINTIKDTGAHQHWRSGGMDIYMNANAEKNFSSLWFKQNDTPWNTDLEAARAAECLSQRLWAAEPARPPGAAPHATQTALGHGLLETVFSLL